MGGLFETLQRGVGTLYGVAGGIWVMVLHAKPTAADMYLARPALKSMLQRHPHGFPTLTWVLPEAGLSMDGDARAAATEVTREYDASVLAMATLIEGQGFQAAAVRAIVSALDLMARARAPKKVFGDLAASVAWCVSMRAPQEREPPVLGDVVEAIEAMRRGLVRPR